MPLLTDSVLSVVIRSRNEAAWIGRCLFALAHQRRAPLDVIVVDSESSDETVAIAERMGARVLRIRAAEFSYGRAINLGIAAARHEACAVLSAHCIPVNDLWADYMAAALSGDGSVAGVYGRQEPLPDSSAFDKRDLWLTFREERILQSKDIFFHNANSALTKATWERFPFNESINGQEDREWGQRVIAAGYAIRYEPEARVYHFHGIHQGRNEARANRVVRVIEHLRNGVIT